MIIFKKILSYDLKPQTGSVFPYLVGLGLQEIDPPTREPDALALSTGTVLHSTLRRAEECLKKEPKRALVPLHELREALFDLSAFCSEDTWIKEGSSIVRKKFKEFFIQDTLPESRDALFSDVRLVLKRCAELGGDVTVVSHSFKLKIFEAYIKTKGELVRRPALIEGFIFDEKKTFEFGGGFECDQVF